MAKKHSEIFAYLNKYNHPYLIKFKGDTTFNIKYECKFCYQTPEWMHICTPNITCKYNNKNRLIKTNCTIKDTYHCLGNF